jgi:hypothetical protein
MGRCQLLIPNEPTNTVFSFIKYRIHQGRGQKATTRLAEYLLHHHEELGSLEYHPD